MTENSKKAAKPKLTVKNGKVYGDALSAEEKKRIVAEKKKANEASAHSPLSSRFPMWKCAVTELAR